MITFSNAIRTALADSAAELAWLVAIADASNTIRLTSWSNDVTYSGNTFKGDGSLLFVRPPDGAVINRGGHREASLELHDPQGRMLACVQSFIESPVTVTARIIFLNISAKPDLIIFRGQVSSVALNDSKLKISVTSKLDLQRSNPVYLTDQAQKQRKAGDNVLNQLARDIYIDWRG